MVYVYPELYQGKDNRHIMQLHLRDTVKDSYVIQKKRIVEVYREKIAMSLLKGDTMLYNKKIQNAERRDWQCHR